MNSRTVKMIRDKMKFTKLFIVGLLAVVGSLGIRRTDERGPHLRRFIRFRLAAAFSSFPITEHRPASRRQQLLSVLLHSVFTLFRANCRVAMLPRPRDAKIVGSRFPFLHVQEVAITRVQEITLLLSREIEHRSSPLSILIS